MHSQPGSGSRWLPATETFPGTGIPYFEGLPDVKRGKVGSEPSAQVQAQAMSKVALSPAGVSLIPVQLSSVCLVTDPPAVQRQSIAEH